MIARPVQAGRLGALGDARRAAADDDQPVDGPGGGLADLAVALVARVAELEHLAEDGAAASGQPGQQVERGDDGPRRGVVRVVDDGHPPSRTTATRCGADQPAARPAAISSSDRPAASPTAAAARALWTDRRPRTGMVTARRAASARQDEAHPVEPERLDRLGADIGVRREAVGHDPRRRPVRPSLGRWGRRR